MRGLPASAWERFLEDGDDETLLASVHTQPPVSTAGLPDYPAHHRICDVKLQGKAYRLTRVMNMESGHEQLYIEPTDFPAYEHEGVPYRLNGEALRRWIIDEQKQAAKEEVDWDEWRASER
ncbi:MAG: hypothetical protein ACO1SX_18215 [Actinomycetota bacterium]